MISVANRKDHLACFKSEWLSSTSQPRFPRHGMSIYQAGTVIMGDPSIGGAGQTIPLSQAPICDNQKAMLYRDHVPPEFDGL